jgi:23S rRNA pseudouridine1911/1915/1917 synthase
LIEMTRIRGGRAKVRRPEGVPEGAVVTVFRVPPEDEGQRLDVFVRGQLRRTSRTRTQRIIAASAFDAAGRRLRSNDRVRAEQQILLWRAPWDEGEVNTVIPIVYEDEHLLAVDKPPMLPVHPTARYHNNTLIKLLQSARPGEFLSLGHRLDRETSGLLIVSKTPECDRALKRRFEAREGIDKTYLAMTWGVPDPGDGSRVFRFERDVELDRGHRSGVKMRVATSGGGLHAVTRFVVEESVVTDGGRAYAKVRCGLETGRQHQIRVHLAALGAPIVGDKLYGPDDGCFARGADGALTEEDALRLELPRHALHAAGLTLAHPITGAHLVLEAPMPLDLVEFWRAASGRL